MTYALDIPRGRPQYAVAFVNGPATCGPRLAPKGLNVIQAIKWARVELIAADVPPELLFDDAAVVARADKPGAIDAAIENARKLQALASEPIVTYCGPIPETEEGKRVLAELVQACGMFVGGGA